MGKKEGLKLLSSQQAAEVLGVTASTVSRWARYGKLKGMREGRWYRFHPEALMGLLQELYSSTEVKQRVKRMNQILGAGKKVKTGAGSTPA